VLGAFSVASKRKMAKITTAFDAQNSAQNSAHITAYEPAGNWHNPRLEHKTWPGVLSKKYNQN
jgi:hypothetical protein